MKKMLQISAAALLVSFISLPSTVSAQSIYSNQDSSMFSAPVVIVAGISIIIVVGFALSLLDLKKDIKEA